MTQCTNMTVKKKYIRKNYVFTEDFVKIINKVQEEMKAPSETAAVIQAIMYYHQKIKDDKQEKKH